MARGETTAEFKASHEMTDLVDYLREKIDADSPVKTNLLGASGGWCAPTHTQPLYGEDLVACSCALCQQILDLMEERP